MSFFQPEGLTQQHLVSPCPVPAFHFRLEIDRCVSVTQGVALGLELSRLRREELVKPEANVHSILLRWFSSPEWGREREICQLERALAF
jgi:hypothetical protein